MPLTPFQVEVLAILKANRREESHFAGGLVLHADAASARYSRDFDIFHETAAEVVRSSQQDVERLRHAGFEVELISSAGEWEKTGGVSLRKARVHRGDQQVEIDWASDTAFRFFPVVEEELLGWKLHLGEQGACAGLAHRNARLC